jgi:cephalosporin-C deacetylase
MLYDLSLNELRKFKPDRKEPVDFDAFWENTISDAKKNDLNAVFTSKDFGLTLFDIFDVRFNGYAGQPINGWFILPKDRDKPLPCVVEYIGYGGGRGFPTDWLLFPSAGFATFIMDTRGQGSSWSVGDTGDISIEGSGPHFPGFMTLGVLDPHTYYYRRVYTDAFRAIQAARSHPSVDGTKIAVTGVSQGGGISIAISGLVEGLSAVMPDVPYLCNFRRAVTITDELPYHEISRFLRVHRDKADIVFNTLAYFDGMHFAARANAPALFSTALMDPICPPSTVFSAYNHYHGDKKIEVYEFNLHDGGGSHHEIKKVKYLRDLWQ